VTDGTGLERYNSLSAYWARENAIIAGCVNALGGAGAGS
jgi:hypothetical protein